MADVFFTENEGALAQLIGKSRILGKVSSGDSVAIKLHVGEPGNEHYLKPGIAKAVIGELLALGAKPFLTDTRTLYKGKRYEEKSHIETAGKHGFLSLGVPFVVADAKGEFKLKCKGVLKEVSVGAAFKDVDFLFVLSHCKGHPEAAFGGALKNVAMGCATRESKLAQHRAVELRVETKKCTGCKLCTAVCKFGALEVEDRVVWTDEKCARCGKCIETCPNSVFSFSNEQGLQKAIASAAAAVLEFFKGRSAFLSAAKEITRWCDCLPNPGGIIHEDVGFFASLDAVAIDSAFVDAVGADVLEKANRLDPAVQLKEAEKLGAGSRKYKLVKI